MPLGLFQSGFGLKLPLHVTQNHHSKNTNIHKYAHMLFKVLTQLSVR